MGFGCLQVWCVSEERYYCKNKWFLEERLLGAEILC
jgi:hypothetical protein